VLVARATDEVEALVPGAVLEECDELEPPQAASSSTGTRTKARRITSPSIDAGLARGRPPYSPA